MLRPPISRVSGAALVIAKMVAVQFMGATVKVEVLMIFTDGKGFPPLCGGLRGLKAVQPARQIRRILLAHKLPRRSVIVQALSRRMLSILFFSIWINIPIDNNFEVCFT